jgi:hypothetical protein
MENLSEKAVYKLNLDCGRQGTLRGLFIAKKKHVKLLLENKLEVYFGEVLGKHSEIYGEIEEKHIVIISDSQDVIDVIETHQLENGFSPFDYTVINTKREDFEGLTILEIVEILEKENNE